MNTTTTELWICERCGMIYDPADGDPDSGIAPGTVFGRVTAQLITGAITEADLPLPVTEPAVAGVRGLKELYYEVGAQVAHLADARI